MDGRSTQNITVRFMHYSPHIQCAINNLTFNNRKKNLAEYKIKHKITPK